MINDLYKNYNVSGITICISSFSVLPLSLSTLIYNLEDERPLLVAKQFSHVAVGAEIQ